MEAVIGITSARKKRIVGQAFQPDSEPCQAGMSRVIRFALSDAQESLAMTSVIFYLRRLTARAMIRSRVSSFAGNCLTISPS